jgi:signal transduction histidine kinase
VFAASFVAFGGLIDVQDWPAAYLAPLPLLLWAAARFGVGGTALALLAMAGGIIVQTVQLHGPFAGQPLPAVEEVASLHIFLAATSAPLMLLAALMDERRRAATLLRQSEERLQFAAGATDTALWQGDADPPRLWLTDNCRDFFGLEDEATNTPLAFLDAVEPEDQAAVGDAIAEVLNGGEPKPAIEFRLRSGERTRWFVLEMRTDADEVHNPAIVSGVFRDISDRVEARREVERLQKRLTSLREDERRRIAEELHDSTAQHLVAAKLNLLNLRQRLPEDLHQLLDEARRSLLEATAEIRTFTYLLHPAQLDEEGLCQLLRRYAPGFERRTGIVTELRLDERADRLPVPMQQALLRITQESLGNVQRHARATRARVDLRCFAGNVHLIVRDDGKGICARAGALLGERLRLGTPSMTARVEQLGGRIDVEARGSGTRVHVAIPIERPTEMPPSDVADLMRVN